MFEVTQKIIVQIDVFVCSKPLGDLKMECLGTQPWLPCIWSFKQDDKYWFQILSGLSSEMDDS